ncbi:MAG: hypothetical protein ABSE52_06030 [Candidatus Dormibacteria bacterium]|jgi:hypothetical protein
MTGTAADDQERLFRALGWLVASSAWLELLVFYKLVSRSGVPMTTAKVLMGTDGFETTLSRLDRLASATLPKEVEEDFKAWCSDARTAMTERGKLVHAVWLVPGRDGKRLDRLERDRLPVDGIKATATEVHEIEALAQRLDGLSARLVDMAGALRVLAE